jgi:hypothetical protein
MLSDAGLDLQHLNPHPTWTVFKNFAAPRVEDLEPDPDNDMLFNQWQTAEWSGIEGLQFGWSLVRQFTLYDSACEYDHMEQLECLLLVPTRPEFEQLDIGSGLFWPSSHLADFADEVKQGEAFAVLRDLPVTGSWIVQERV